jgi:hypothetical protein
MIRHCPRCHTEYHANGRNCPECGRANLRLHIGEQLRIRQIVSRETSDDAAELAEAVADLSDELARAG